MGESFKSASAQEGIGFLHEFWEAIMPYRWAFGGITGNGISRIVKEPNYKDLMNFEALYTRGQYTALTADILPENNVVSMGEAFIYAKFNDDFFNPASLWSTLSPDLPIYWESIEGLGGKTYL